MEGGGVNEAEGGTEDVRGLSEVAVATASRGSGELLLISDWPSGSSRDRRLARLPRCQLPTEHCSSVSNVGKARRRRPFLPVDDTPPVICDVTRL